MPSETPISPTRRKLIKLVSLLLPSSLIPAGLAHAAGRAVPEPEDRSSSQDFQSVPFTRDDWEGLNPGYWRHSETSLRRRIKAIGDRARNTGFPYHYESGWEPEGQMPISYDPSLPLGISWNRKWRLGCKFAVSVNATVKALTEVQRPDDDTNWRMYREGYGLFGLAFGAATQFESYYPSDSAAPMLIVRETGRCSFARHTSEALPDIDADQVADIGPLAVGDVVKLSLAVAGQILSATLTKNDGEPVVLSVEFIHGSPSGFLGIAARGLLDVELTDLELLPGDAEALLAPVNECHVCYPLGDTLKKETEGWRIRFIALFRNPGERAKIRISSQEDGGGDWSKVPVAGDAAIVSNDFRVNTAVIDALIPGSLADQSFYYTIWKDGVDVTADPRFGTDSVGPGTGLVGDVPGNGLYVGRLPRLRAPYRIAGLSCHAVHTAGRADLPGASAESCASSTSFKSCHIAQPFFVHDQPCYGAFRNLEAFDYQVMLWEDDVWYLELLLYPPSTEDAYRQITLALAGPTTRWQMMRHLNVINPGDHDYGMDDVKGPEQILVRNRSDLGQDPDYMARNFQIVSHLISGDENPSKTDNPKRWRTWKMPNRDFSLIVTDSRLWRSSQDTAIWDDEGWGHDRELYSRKDPTRTLLGEEQFAWLAEQLKTDSSPLICITGMNALHTIWSGHDGRNWYPALLERDRVSADYAGWVTAGANRVLDLMEKRSGIVSVYGDVHAGSIVKNKARNLYECSFGPIGRWGGRGLVEGFKRDMQDQEGRDIECIALYHNRYQSPDLDRQESINYWNVLEAEFDTRPSDPLISLAIRNIKDKPGDEVRGGGSVRAAASETGRAPSSRLPEVHSLNDADVLILRGNNAPLRGLRSDSRGVIAPIGLADVEVGERLTLLVSRGNEVASHQVLTLPTHD